MDDIIPMLLLALWIMASSVMTIMFILGETNPQIKLRAHQELIDKCELPITREQHCVLIAIVDKGEKE